MMSKDKERISRRRNLVHVEQARRRDNGYTYTAVSLDADRGPKQISRFFDNRVASSQEL